MVHTIEQVLAYVRSATHHESKPKGVVAAKRAAGFGGGNHFQDGSYDPIEIQLAPFQYVGNILKR